MPAITQILLMLTKTREKKRRNPFATIAIILAMLVGFLTAGGAVYLSYQYAIISSSLPAISDLPGRLEPPEALVLTPTQFFDRTGNDLIATIKNPAAGERKYLFFPDKGHINESLASNDLLPGNLISATIAASKISPINEPGFPQLGQLFDKTPSLSERLVIEFLLKNEPDDLHRSIRQKLIGAQITHEFGVEKIIEWYLNNTSFGQLAYGVNSASQLYFDKPAQKLSFAEAALLVAIAEINDPYLPEKRTTLIARQKEIIQQALKLRILSPQEGIEAIREEPVMSDTPDLNFKDFIVSEGKGDPTAFLAFALKQVGSIISQTELERGGLRIYTTMNRDLQYQLECTARAQQMRTSANPDQKPAGIPADCTAARLLPTSTNQELAQNYALESVILDPINGQILGLNNLLSDGQSDNVPEKHPIGTLGSTFVYLTGFTRGLSPATLLWDIPDAHSPTNEGSGVDYHGPVRLRVALANDYLNPVSSVLALVGMENVYRITRQTGILSPEPEIEKDPSLANLFRPMDLLEVGQAFSIFPNQGRLTGHTFSSPGKPEYPTSAINPALPTLEATTILFIQDSAGEVRADWRESQSRPILTPALAYLMTNVLSDETARWPGMGHPNPLEIGRPAGVKMGNDPESNNNWVIGYTPKHLVGVWLGSQDKVKITGAEDAVLQDTANRYWHAIMQYSSQNQPYEDFKIPPGVDSLQVCDPSGLLPTVACPNVVDEKFLAGDEPTQLDTLFRLVQINRNNNLLATIFTPPDLVEERSYLIAPLEAQKWAHQAGWETPPDVYDPLPAKTKEWPDTVITTPAMFSPVRGAIAITGRATGSNFSFYRVQYGKGPNPDLWMQVGADSNNPIADGKLATLDSTSMDGLYAIQLLLVRDDQSAERATVLVTVDNQPPRIQIIRPLPEETIPLAQKKSIVLQTEISDNLQVKSVEIRIDGRLLATLYQPPFSISWITSPGEHTLKVTAYDTAGNQTTADVKFFVK